MNRKTVSIIFILVLLAATSGCATQSGRTGGSVNPLCTLAGAAVGGGGAAAITLAAGPIGAGAFVGAMLGTLACTEGPPPAKAPVAAAAPPPPQQVRDLDSDNDGVIDRLDRCPDTPAGQRVDSNGCPEVLLVLTGVNFKFDSSQITPDSAQILNKAVEALNKANTVDVLIVGYTDSVGSDAYNLKLSQRRANAVRDYLVGHGISADRLSTDGMGESQPVASNDTAEGRYQNRRVEFRVKGYEPMSSSSGEEGTTAGENSSIETWRQLKQTVVYPPQ